MTNQRRFALIGRGFGSDSFDEVVTDLIGGILVDSSEINFTFTDATPSITAALIDASITFARLQNFDALSVLGRSVNSSGVSDEIAAGANDRLLRRTSDTLNFGQLTAGMFPNTVVPDAALSSNVPLLNATQTFTGANTFRGITYINPDPQTPPANSIDADAQLVLIDNAAISIQQLKIGTGSMGYRFIAAGNTFASPSAIDTTNTSYMGFIGGSGYDGTAWNTASRGLVGIRPVATWSNTSHPTRVTLETTPVASTTRAQVAAFDQAEIDLTATLLDFNGTLDVDGDNHDISTTGTLTISGTGETLATFVDDGAVTLYYNNTARIATTSAGVAITGSTLSITDTAGVEITFSDPDSASGTRTCGWRNSGGQCRIISRDDSSVFVENLFAANLNSSSQWTTMTWTCDDFVIDHGALRLVTTISPTQLTANTDNWNPTSLANSIIIRASTDASRNLTGIVAPSDGRLLILINVGSQDLVLKHDVTSTAANRFLLPNSADLTLNPNDSVTLWYDTTSDRWRPISGV